MSASATIVSFLPIESCRLESLPKDTTLLNTEVLKILVVTIFAATLLLKTGMLQIILKRKIICGVGGKLSF